MSEDIGISCQNVTAMSGVTFSQSFCLNPVYLDRDIYNCSSTNFLRILQESVFLRIDTITAIPKVTCYVQHHIIHPTLLYSRPYSQSINNTITTLYKHIHITNYTALYKPSWRLLGLVKV